VMFSTGKLSSVEGWLIDNRPVELTDGDEGDATSAPYVQSTFGGTSPIIAIYYRDGSDSHTAFDLYTHFPDIWSTDHKGNGITYALLVSNGVPQEKWNVVYPNRIPSLNLIGSFGEIYDPRTEAAAYSNNFALIMRDYLTHADGLGLPESMIDDDLFSTAADDCDYVIDTLDGTTPRYNGALSYSFNEEPSAIITRLMAACDGRLYLTTEGKIGISVGVWVEPTLTITDDHILDYDLRAGNGPLSSANHITVKYEEPLASYAEAACEPLVDSADVDVSGVRKLEVEAFEVQSHNHARRLAKILYHRGAPEWQGTIVTTLFGFQAWDQRWIRITLADLEIDENFEVQSITLDPETMRVTITVMMFGAAAYEFDPDTEEGAAPTIPESVEEGAVGEPENLDVTPGTREIVTGIFQNYLTITWDAIADRNDVRAEVQYSIANLDAWVPVAVAENALTAEAPNTLIDVYYDVRARWVTGGGTAGPWNLIEDVDT